MSISSDLNTLIGNGLDYNWDTARAQILQGLTLLDQGLYDASGHTHAAADIVSGTIANARINWAAPSAIGGTTPAAGTFSALTASLTSGAQLVLNANAGAPKQILFNSANVQRWLMYSDTVAEGGANAGSDFRILRYNDAGVFQDTPLLIVRATGNIVVGAGLTITGALDHDGTTVGLFGATPQTRTAMAAATGTPQRTTFATGAVTLPQLAGVVMAMITDLRATGYWN